MGRRYQDFEPVVAGQERQGPPTGALRDRVR
jgi:hypothetical protein